MTLKAPRKMGSSRWGGAGKKAYKQVYHSLRRTQTRVLERAALIGDELRAEAITPDGFKGAIAWDIT